MFFLKGDREASNAVLIIDNFGGHKLLNRRREKQRNLAAVCRDPPVLVGIAQFVQSPEEMRPIGCPSVVRLKRSNLIDSKVGDAEGLPSQSLSPIRIVDAIGNRKLSMTGIYDPAASLYEAPDKLIEATPHTVKGVTNGQWNIVRDFGQFCFDNVLLSFRIILASNGIRVVTLERFNQCIQRFKVSRCPTKF